MSVVNYKLRDDIKYLVVCLYNPSGSSEETQYTFSSLWDYILDCGWQLEQGEKIKRFPYHISPCLADAEKAQRDFKLTVSTLRKERSADNTDNTDNTAVSAADRAIRTADHAFIRRSIPQGDIQTAVRSQVISPSNRQKEKRFTGSGNRR